MSLTNKATQNRRLPGLISSLLLLETFHSHHKGKRARRTVSPPDRTTRICISLATPGPLPGHRSSIQTFSDPQTTFTLQENLEFKVISLRNTWKVSCYVISSYPTSKSVSLFQIPPFSCLHTLINRLLLPFLLGDSFTAQHGVSHEPQWSWPLKGGCFSVLVTITLFVSSCN